MRVLACGLLNCSLISKLPRAAAGWQGVAPDSAAGSVTAFQASGSIERFASF